MNAFATVEQLEDGWLRERPLTESERAVAGVLLGRASTQLAAMLSKRGIAIDASDEEQANNLVTVCCNMVRRSMGSHSADGIQTMQQTIGSTNASVTWSNPDGAFYLSKLDRESLGLVSTGGARFIHAQTAEV